MSIILASSSPYRQQLLANIHIEAHCKAPNINEDRHPNEHPKDLALRLAIAKAQKVARDISKDQASSHWVSNEQPHPQLPFIIGSDQVASLHGKPLGKPHNHANAVNQLQQQSGNVVTFYTAVCVCQGQTSLSDVVTTEVAFRQFNAAMINTYLLKDTPYDCAGSFKSEGLGITLFERITSDDPSALVGLPLIKTLSFLRELGAAV